MQPHWKLEQGAKKFDRIIFIDKMKILKLLNHIFKNLWNVLMPWYISAKKFAPQKQFSKKDIKMRKCHWNGILKYYEYNFSNKKIIYPPKKHKSGRECLKTIKLRYLSLSLSLSSLSLSSSSSTCCNRNPIYSKLEGEKVNGLFQSLDNSYRKDLQL